MDMAEMQESGHDEGQYMQKYQTTLGQSSLLQQRSRTSSLSLQKDPVRTSSSALQKEGSLGPTRTSSSTLQTETSLASSAQGRKQRQPPLAASQGSYDLSEAASETLASTRQGSAAIDEDSSLIAAIQAPVSQREGEQAEAQAVAAQAKARKTPVVKSKALQERRTSVADRLKSLRGMVDADVEPQGDDGDPEIQEDLPVASQQPIDYGNIDEPIPEEAELAA